jgi:hypothetical protein
MTPSAAAVSGASVRVPSSGVGRLPVRPRSQTATPSFRRSPRVATGTPPGRRAIEGSPAGSVSYSSCCAPSRAVPRRSRVSRFGRIPTTPGRRANSQLTRWIGWLGQTLVQCPGRPDRRARRPRLGRGWGPPADSSGRAARRPRAAESARSTRRAGRRSCARTRPPSPACGGGPSRGRRAADGSAAHSAPATVQPSTSRTPRSLTPTAMSSAPGTTRPASCTVAGRASSHREGERSAASGRSRTARRSASSSARPRLTWRLRLPEAPSRSPGRRPCASKPLPRGPPG